MAGTHVFEVAADQVVDEVLVGEDLQDLVLADGRRIRIVHDWSEGSDESRFLHDVRDGACSFFDGVLSPDYNAAHRDHLHLDRGSYRMCR